MYELDRIEKQFLKAYDIPVGDYKGISAEKLAKLERCAALIEGRILFQELPNGWVLNDFYAAQSKGLALMKCLTGADSVSPLFRGSGIEKQVRDIFLVERPLNSPQVEQVIKEIKGE